MDNLLQRILDQLPEEFLNRPCIVTFGSSQTEPDSTIGKAAKLVGRKICEHEYVNCNGGQGGTMQLVSGVVSQRSLTVGVKRQMGSNWNQCGHVITCATNEFFPYSFGMAVRKGVMISLGHGFVVFLDPNGGPGTGTELQTLIEMTMNLMDSGSPDHFYRPIAVICESRNYGTASQKIAHYFGEKGIVLREANLNNWLSFQGHDRWLQLYAADNPDGSFNPDAVKDAFNFVQSFLNSFPVDRDLPGAIA